MSFTDRFTGRADAYVVGRPSYPPESIDAMIAGLGAPASLVVADLGAGTGISSRVIAARGPSVLAIEPNAAMRDAAAPADRITWVDGTAEKTTLESASVDVIAAFQAWHWVDHAAAVAEARRIVRHGGRLVVVYNERDERDPFTAGYGEIVRRYATDATEERRARALANALSVDPAHTTRTDFVNLHELDAAGLQARTDSSSYLPHTGDAAAALHADVDALFRRFSTGAKIPMHLLTTVVRVDL